MLIRRLGRNKEEKAIIREIGKLPLQMQNDIYSIYDEMCPYFKLKDGQLFILGKGLLLLSMVANTPEAAELRTKLLDNMGF